MQDFQSHGRFQARLNTRENENVFDRFEYVYRDSKIKGPGGSTYEMNGVEVPSSWSQLAVDILAQKYMRKTGVPSSMGRSGSEYSVKQVVHRLANTWRKWGERYGYFTKQEGGVFYDEVVFDLLDQRAAPNSPQWFNTGLYDEYGISGPAQGHYFADPSTGEILKSQSAYERPQPHACFILSVKDDLVNEGGIMDLFLREARVFKYGSGSGVNYSALRGKHERLSGGGFSSGLLSFLRVGDAAAAAIRSGGTTRRAARMVVVDIDHPEIEAFIRWKHDEEKKARVLMKAGYDGSMEGEAYRTVSGQQSNNSVRIPDEFFHELKADGKWKLTARIDSHSATYLSARHLWNELVQAAWACGDPGVQFDTTINAWHTCPGAGRIRASNPCSEFMFIDDSACNLASINLLRFYDARRDVFNVDSFKHTCRLWTTVLELSVLMAHYPSEAVARHSFEYRPLGLGFTNLGGLLLAMGVPYDSIAGRELAAAIASLMTATAYQTSAEWSSKLGAFRGHESNEHSMFSVLARHASETEKIASPGYRDTYGIASEAKHIWRNTMSLGRQFGFRNAQVTLLAPAGTISLLMDADTTGIEPEYALVKEKKMIDGVTVRQMNRQVENGLRNLGLDEKRVKDVTEFLHHHGTLEGCHTLSEDQVRVFDTSLPPAPGSKRMISPEGHLLMMAAVQPFLSGAISKTVNLPHDATVTDVEFCFRRAWELGLKSMAIYRDGCKSDQPLHPVYASVDSTWPQEFDGDPAPHCVDCGSLTVRSGSCFRCFQCGATLECS